MVQGERVFKKKMRPNPRVTPIGLRFQTNQHHAPVVLYDRAERLRSMLESKR